MKGCRLGIGWAMFLVSVLISIYYNMLIAYSLYYLFASFKATLPWKECGEWSSKACSSVTTDVITNCTGNDGKWCLGACIHKSEVNTSVWESLKDCAEPVPPSDEYFHNIMLDLTEGVHDIGNMKWELALCLLLSWVIVCFCLAKGIKSSGKKPIPPTADSKPDSERIDEIETNIAQINLKGETNLAEQKNLSQEMSRFIQRLPGWKATLKGNKGDPGPPGPVGVKGDIGPRGHLGLMGEKGGKGKRGNKGDVGQRGKTGQKGQKGHTGNTGEVGCRGETGQKGQKGETGNTGVVGSRGKIGQTGEKGETDNTGEEGRKGETDEKGQKGSLDTVDKKWRCREQKCYYFGSDKKTWHDAREICKRLGTDLVEIDSEEENTFLTNQACYTTVDAYLGTESTTTDGTPCQRWDSQSPHRHNYTIDQFPDESFCDSANFCRDPSGIGKLWCYTEETDIERAFCNVPRCDEYWIGAEDINNEGTWTWAASQRQFTTEQFSNWNDGEPNNDKDKCDDGEDCLQIYLNDEHGSWNDNCCDAKRKYICMKSVFV